MNLLNSTAALLLASAIGFQGCPSTALAAGPPYPGNGGTGNGPPVSQNRTGVIVSLPKKSGCKSIAKYQFKNTDRKDSYWVFADPAITLDEELYQITSPNDPPPPDKVGYWIVDWTPQRAYLLRPGQVIHMNFSPGTHVKYSLRVQKNDE